MEDHLTSLRDKIVAADAYVFGAPNYYATLNATTHALLERWFQFRHQVGNPLMAHGEGAKITDEMIPDVTKPPKAMAAAVQVGKLLQAWLKNSHDHMAVMKKMQEKMMAMLKSSA